MKRLFSKLALVFTITLMASISTSCGNDDEDISENTPKDCTYYINTEDFKLDADAPFTKEQFDKEYRDALYKGCDGKTLYNQELLDVIRATYKKQVARGWIKYIHGYALIMCHSISLHEEVPMYEYYIDTGIIDYIYAS